MELVEKNTMEAVEKNTMELVEKVEHHALSQLSEKILKASAQYDDGEDRVLTAKVIVDWKSVYVATAIAYTQVPEKVKHYFKQMLRWRKGTIRSSIFVSSFLWRRASHPFMAIMFYIELMLMFISPAILVAVFIYEPLVLHKYLGAIFLAMGLLISAVAQGLDYRFRDKAGARYWPFQIIMSFLTVFVLSWLVIPALIGIRKNVWLTR